MVNPKGCAINLRASYDTQLYTDTSPVSPYESLVIDLQRSQVKIQGGWWASLAPRCAESKVGAAYYAHEGARLIYLHYESLQVSRACVLDFACFNHRRYKFFVCRIGPEDTIVPICREENGKWIYYPNSSGWTKQTTIDLGDLGERFPQFQMPAPEKSAPGKSGKAGKKK